MTVISTILIGDGSLLVQCGETLLQRGHAITRVVSHDAAILTWARSKGIAAADSSGGIEAALDGASADWLFSIANLSILSPAVLAAGRKGAVNFHDGPLPRYAGLNAPIWAILAGETSFGVTWHQMQTGVDCGEILVQKTFPIAAEETGFTLNAKCWEAALEGFADLLGGIEGDSLKPIAQTPDPSTFHIAADRPTMFGFIDPEAPVADTARLVRALDHGDHANPVCVAKLMVGDAVFAVKSAVFSDVVTPKGQIGLVSGEAITIGLADGSLRLGGITTLDGQPVRSDATPRTGQEFLMPDPDLLAASFGRAAQHEAAIRRDLEAGPPIQIALAGLATGPADIASLPVEAPRVAALAALLRSAAEGGRTIGIATDATDPFLHHWVPLVCPVDGSVADLEAALSRADRLTAAGGFSRDLALRFPTIRSLDLPQILIVEDAEAFARLGGVIGIGVDTLFYDRSRVSDAAAGLFVARIAHIATQLDPAAKLSDLDILPEAERRTMLKDWNGTAKAYDAETCVHQFFEQEVMRRPEDVAVVFEGTSLSYGDLNARANKLAHRLIAMGVSPGDFVGIYVPRSLDLLIGSLAILKAGGAYVPLDPSYPEDRIAHYVDDSGLGVIVTRHEMADDLPDSAAVTLHLDTDTRIEAAPATNPDTGVRASDLAYLIYTSGSTGTPKGVMVEHAQVANFFTGMDDRITCGQGDSWLALTSLSFDISVLELFYTIARGVKLVIASDQSRLTMSSGKVTTSSTPINFSLFFWGNDDGVGPKKYQLLLDAARFGDKNGFSAVWTPERHFHAFGGPYPNPAVTGAAVAAVTENMAVRSGSCVAPLHHTARIAEEWAVIDNLTDGRAGLAVASGWQPDDFVLRPENTPPNNKPAMFQAIEDLRKLWRGEAVAFPTKDGGSFDVVTQPRPVSTELPIWVTIAGNPQTWKEAGEAGAHVLTHLLGQSIDEVAEKIVIYHNSLRENGYDPEDHKVTLMLHTYVGRDREHVRRIVRGPLKDYLQSAAGLIKQCAWDFPAFKKPEGATQPFDIDLQTLSGDELDAILDFAFERYFESSGLFGTVEDCLARVEEVKAIGVSEVACLIDFGIAPATVMEGLFPLAEVLERSNTETSLEEGDYSIAAQIERHGVTHMQATPSMVRMIVEDDGARASLSGLKQILLGGEALPLGLVQSLKGATSARIENMYGPTETTIWSTTAEIEERVTIGTPIANTAVYVLDPGLQPVPVGQPGELYIAGAGVTRGYWQREDMTADRFLPDPFAGSGRMYRTGDLAAWQADGSLSYLGRIDNQVKLRGYRIELGEIEARLEDIPGVRQAVVVVRDVMPGDRRLVAYTTGALNEAAAREELALHLPDYMVPQHFVPLEVFPLTPNNKIDRNALPGLPAARVVPLRSPEEVTGGGSAAAILAIWQRILGVSEIRSGDSFFDLGGHSLLAVQAHREIRAELDIPNLAITDIFRFPTLAALAAHIDGDKQNANLSAVGVPERAARVQGRADAMARRREMRRTRKTG